MKFLRNNGLSLVLASLFLIFWMGQAWSGWHVSNEDRKEHGEVALAFPVYLASGHFWQATAENWESEFLQMGAYVVLTCFLYQKGSAESRDPDDPEEEAEAEAGAKQAGFLYRNSLSLAFVVLFLASFAVHVAGGLVQENEDRAEHQLPPETVGEFLSGSQFWFESFQNWQSEFLAVLSIVTLTIFLRQHGSPESKAVTDPHSKTGK
jgi:hypothetical protein